MRYTHSYLATAPFDLHSIFLFRLVATHGSFTRAAEAAGLTQSAITRQIQSMELGLGLTLFERTTRKVRLTPAGEFLHAASVRLVGDVESTLQRMQEEFGQARKQVRVGVSRSVGLAYLPGFFHANLRRLPEIGCKVTSDASANLLNSLEAHDLDIAVLCAPKRLSATLRVTHRFEDAFTLITPASNTSAPPQTASKKELAKWLTSQNWLLLEERNSTTGFELRRWIKRQGWELSPSMELDNFDLIINLVALGMGSSFVPARALALYGRKRIQRVSLRERFVRELVVVVRKHRKMPEHLAKFVDNILF